MLWNKITYMLDLRFSMFFNLLNIKTQSKIKATKQRKGIGLLQKLVFYCQIRILKVVSKVSNSSSANYRLKNNHGIKTIGPV